MLVDCCSSLYDVRGLSLLFVLVVCLFVVVACSLWLFVCRCGMSSLLRVGVRCALFVNVLFVGCCLLLVIIVVCALLMWF